MNKIYAYFWVFYSSCNAFSLFIKCLFFAPTYFKVIQHALLINFRCSIAFLLLLKTEISVVTSFYKPTFFSIYAINRCLLKTICVTLKYVITSGKYALNIGKHQINWMKIKNKIETIIIIHIKFYKICRRQRLDE